MGWSISSRLQGRRFMQNLAGWTPTNLLLPRCSTSAWASPLRMVPKPDGSWRPCSDYQQLNSVTTSYRYPVPNVQDFTQRFSGKSVFSKIDLVKGYYQVMHPADISKTAIVTPFGLWEFFVRSLIGSVTLGWLSTLPSASLASLLLSFWATLSLPPGWHP